jgi:hypothetical protein
MSKKALYRSGDRVRFYVMPWVFGTEQSYEGTVIDSVRDDERDFYYYHVRDISGFKEKVPDGGIVSEHEIAEKIG